MRDLLDILERLVRHQVEFVLVGGQAGILYGVTLVTRDVDICMPFNPESLSRLHTAVADLHPVHRLTPEGRPFVLAELNLATLKNLYLRTDFGVLDCLGEIAGVGQFAEVQRQSLEVELPIGRCRVLSLEALIAAKAAVNREHDKLALIQLRAIADRRKP